MFNVDLSSRIPIYEQLYKKTVELVIKGILKEGTQLPSVRVLAKQLSVNPNTVSKAYQLLEHDGIIYSTTGIGSFISKIDKKILKEYAFEDFDKAIEEALNASVTKEELIERINNYKGGMQKWLSYVMYTKNLMATS